MIKLIRSMNIKPNLKWNGVFFSHFSKESVKRINEKTMNFFQTSKDILCKIFMRCVRVQKNEF